jgi:Ca-activated chloride channel family protein
MTFLWGGLLALIVVVPLLVLVYALVQRRRRPVAARYSSLVLIRAAQPRSSRLRRHVPFAILALAIGSLAVALARPAVVLSVPVNETTVILAMDVSGSMCTTDIRPTRLAVAQQAATRFIERQAGRTRIGIVAFSGLAAIIQAPTQDGERLSDAIASLLTGRRTAIGSGILAAIDAIAEVDPTVASSRVEGRPGVAPTPVAPGEYAPAIVVVLTDGASNRGPEPIDAARQAVERGIRVYTIGYGTEAGGAMNVECRMRFIGREPGGGGSGFVAPGGGSGFRRDIDDETLIAVAELTGGRYYPAESADELGEVFDALPTSEITDHRVEEVSVAFVGLGAVLVAVALLLGRAWRPLP